MIRNTPSRDIESRSVIDRRPDDRKPERNIHRFAEREAFDGYQSLVVIAGGDGVEFPSPRANKQSIGGEGPGYVDVLLSALFDCRSDLANFFRTEDTVLARVRI